MAVVSQTEAAAGGDLLTQAMSELHNLSGEFTLNPRITAPSGGPQVVSYNIYIFLDLI